MFEALSGRWKSSVSTPSSIASCSNSPYLPCRTSHRRAIASPHRFPKLALSFLDKKPGADHFQQELGESDAPASRRYGMAGLRIAEGDRSASHVSPPRRPIDGG